jgi:hypothetical protein
MEVLISAAYGGVFLHAAPASVLAARLSALWTAGELPTYAPLVLAEAVTVPRGEGHCVHVAIALLRDAPDIGVLATTGRARRIPDGAHAWVEADGEAVDVRIRHLDLTPQLCVRPVDEFLTEYGIDPADVVRS